MTLWWLVLYDIKKNLLWYFMGMTLGLAIGTLGSGAFARLWPWFKIPYYKLKGKKVKFV